MFSVDAHLVQYLAAFIELQLFNVESDEYLNLKSQSQGSARSVFEQILDRSPFYQYLLEVLDPEKREDAVPPGVIKMSDEERIRKNGIFYILIKKFQQFCEFPNKRQIVKIDCVSDKLKPYFLDKADTEFDDEKETADDEQIQWNVSWKKLSFLFLNLKQVHFLNSYRFDNVALDRLVEWVENDRCKLDQVKFIYNDYIGDLDDYQHFFDPNKLDKKQLEKLEKLKWKLSYPQNRNNRRGFVMKLQKTGG